MHPKNYSTIINLVEDGLLGFHKGVIRMVDNQYKLKDKSDTELQEWIAAHKLCTADYIAGIQELINRK